MNVAVKNEAKGNIYYGIHFYPGVAEYQEPDKEPYRVFLNENTLRRMDPTFAGRPVFVEHVDGVDDDIDELKKEADGWVIESFFNSADGKHWVKFIIVSDRGERAIKNGFRLSNCYEPQDFAQGGLWNGVTYAREVTDGEYEHLAVVKHPRYEESVIMTPEEFKKYNSDKEIELKRLSNEGKGKGTMKLKIFKKAKVENTLDLEEMSVVLPKSGKEITILKLVNDADEQADKKDMNAGMADPAHKVKMYDGSYCNVGELVEKHKALHDELEAIKAKKEDAVEHESELSEDKAAVDVEGDDKSKNDEADAGDDDKKENDESDEDAKKKALALAEHEDKEIEAAKKKNAADDKKKLAKEKADRLRNAHLTPPETVVLDLSEDKVARGQARYGS